MSNLLKEQKNDPLLSDAESDIDDAIIEVGLIEDSYDKNVEE